MALTTSPSTLHTCPSLNVIAECKVEQLTRWFPPYVNPAHIGNYEITHWVELGPLGKAEWNGAVWINLSNGRPYGLQQWHWRGLAHDPALQSISNNS